ncbi:MAG: hydrogenase maturation nickel metallochaperone HypA [Planctomycetes bacterium]|nr:hydrogenase maturation nickel metallochaperone HypA [Planctomycetota bacterium]
MHEVGIIRSTLDAAADASGGADVAAVHLRIGALTGVVPAALQHAWTALRAGTVCEEARLAIEIVPGRCHCAPCAAVFASSALIPACPHCGRPPDAILAGRELELATLELATPCASTAAAC